MNRQEYNRKILTRIQEEIEKHPDYRFHQILWMLGISSCENNDSIRLVADKFYEESKITYEGLINESFNV